MPDRTPLTTPTIDAGEIHLWHLHLSDAHHAPEDWLDQHELTRLKKFVVQTQANRYRASRCAIRRILGDYLGVAPGDLQFSIRQGGKPFVRSPECDLQFNLTHTADTGMLAVSRGVAVGIDIERIRPMKNKHAIARRVFDAAETTALKNTPDLSQDEHFFKLWTSMEARQKCLGSGIFGDKVSDRSVGIHRFTPIPGYCAAVAWSEPSTRPSLQFLDYSPG